MKHILIALLAGFSSLACFGQYNNNYSFLLDSYKDPETVKATELVNDREVMTVGYAPEAGSREGSSDIVLIKTRQADGSLVWSKTYGLDGVDEKGFGLTVSYDKRHVIVCGSAQSTHSRTDWNALVMKINIATGDVVWSSQLGEVHENDEFRMVEKVYPDQDAAGNNSPTYMLVGSTSYERTSVLFAASVHDQDGTNQWSNYYAKRSTLGSINDYALSMVQGYLGQFFICGTRKYEDQSRIFTFRINPYNGNPAYSYVTINASNLYLNEMNQYGGAICKFDWDGSDLIGYAIACTSLDPEVGRGGFVEEAITVLVLDQKGKSLYGGLYWERGYKGNRGLSIYQSVIDRRESTLDVYTNTYNETYDPGFLNIDISGPANYFYKYGDREQFNDKLPTSMVQNQFGYTAKVLNTDQEDSRFQLLQLGEDGRTDCIKNENALHQRIETEDELVEYEKTPYGRYSRRTMESVELEVSLGGCVDETRTPILNPQDNSKTTALSSLDVYPNPVSDIVAVRIKGESLENGSVVLMSSLGKVFYEKRIAVDRRTVEFNLVELPSGMYFVQFTDALGNTEVKKVIKH